MKNLIRKLRSAQIKKKKSKLSLLQTELDIALSFKLQSCKWMY